MSRPKTHYVIYTIHPSEADPEGDSVLACGRDGADLTTHSKSAVTCKICLRAVQPKESTA